MMCKINFCYVPVFHRTHAPTGSMPGHLLSIIEYMARPCSFPGCRYHALYRDLGECVCGGMNNAYAL